MGADCYKDVADEERLIVNPKQPPFLRGGRAPFPSLLHTVLEEAEEKGYDDVCGWLPHGRGFRIHSKQRFISEVLDRHFRNQSHFTSFQRQLNLYGIRKIEGSKNRDVGCYFHEKLLRGRPDLALFVKRHGKQNLRYDAGEEPDLYSFPPIAACQAFTLEKLLAQQGYVDEPSEPKKKKLKSFRLPRPLISQPKPIVAQSLASALVAKSESVAHSPSPSHLFGQVEDHRSGSSANSSNIEPEPFMYAPTTRSYDQASNPGSTMDPLMGQHASTSYSLSGSVWQDLADLRPEDLEPNPVFHPQSQDLSRQQNANLPCLNQEMRMLEKIKLQTLQQQGMLRAPAANPSKSETSGQSWPNEVCKHSNYDRQVSSLRRSSNFETYFQGQNPLQQAALLQQFGPVQRLMAMRQQQDNDLPNLQQRSGVGSQFDSMKYQYQDGLSFEPLQRQQGRLTNDALSNCADYGSSMPGAFGHMG